MNKNWKSIIAAANLTALSLGGLSACSKSEEPAEDTTMAGCGGCATAGDDMMGGCGDDHMMGGCGDSSDEMGCGGCGDSMEGGCGGDSMEEGSSEEM